MDVQTVIGMIQSLLSLTIAAAAFYYARKKDTTDNTKEFAEMTAELRIMRRDITDMNQSVKALRSDREEDHDQLVKLITQIDKMWFYMDQVKEKLAIK